MINLRAVVAALKQESYHFFADPQWVIPSLVAPFTFTIVTLMLFKDFDGPVALYAVLGGGVLGMWGNTLYASGWSVSFDRMNGTLEPLMVTPTPIIQVIAGRGIWNSAIGLLNALAVFVVAEIAIGTGMRLGDPFMFFALLMLTLLSLSTVGLMLSAFFVMTRSSSVLMRILELPIYLLSGALIPITYLPDAIKPLSYLLGPAWGVDALRVAAGISDEYISSLGLLSNVMLMLALTLAYITIAIILFRHMEQRARINGTLGRW